MPSSAISWNEGNPADSSVMSALDLRSEKTAFRTGLAAEHYWPSASGAAGAHLLGAARTFFAAQSFVSSVGTDGILFVASDSSRLFHVGSESTMLLGGIGTLSAGSTPVGGQRFLWEQDIQSFNVPSGAADASATPTFFDSGFSGLPFPLVSMFTADTSATTMYFSWIQSLSPTQMTVKSRAKSSASNAPNGVLAAVIAYAASVGTHTL